MRLSRVFPPGVVMRAPAHLRGKLGATVPIERRRERIEWIARRRCDGWAMVEIGAALGITKQAVSALVREHGLDELAQAAQQDEPGGGVGGPPGSTLPAGPGCHPAKSLHLPVGTPRRFGVGAFWEMVA